MSGLSWFTDNWFNLLNSFGIVGGLLFTTFSLRSETKTRRVANLLTITRNHREIWSEFSRRPELHRILDERPSNMKRIPCTQEEEIFVNAVVLHLNSAFEALKNDLYIKPEGLRRDVSTFFSLPIPDYVWEKTKILQDDDFVAWVESCLNCK